MASTELFKNINKRLAQMIPVVFRRYSVLPLTVPLHCDKKAISFNASSDDDVGNAVIFK